jgi:hypothetical protein
MSRFRIGKRQSKRTKSVVPVRVWIAWGKDSHLAHTLVVSNHEVKLSGCQGEMKVGDKIEIQYQHKHAQFQVSWIISRKGSSSSQKEIGAECLEPEKQVWGTDFPRQVDEYEEKDWSWWVGWAC